MFCNRFKFSTKLIAALSVATLIISGITGLITYKVHLSLFNQEISRQYRQTTKQVLARLDSRVKDMYRITDYITLNPSVKTAILNQTAGATSFERMQVERVLDEQLYQVRLDAPEMIGMRIYDLKGNIMNLGTLSGSFQRLDPTCLEDMIDRLEGTAGEYVWSRVKLDPGSQMEPTNWVMAGRLMRSVDLETYGMMLILFNTSLFESHLKDLRVHEDANAYLFDGDGKLLYSLSGDAESVPDLPELGTDANLIQKEGGISYLYTNQVADKVNFSLVSKVSLEQIQSRSKVILQVAIISALASLFCSWLIITVISRRLLRPLGSLVQGMRRVREGKFDTRVSIRTRDELAFIGDSFNRMTSRIETLIHEVYEREISEKEAELKAIQAQLNPHFLYNTLGMFFWKFYMHGDENSAQLVNNLSEMLQYTLEPVQHLTTLHDEIKQINNYLEIQKARYQEALSTEIDLPDELLNCPVIRLLLQPIVENVFVHAFRNKKNDRRLTISGYRMLAAGENPEQLVLEIADNGSGMDQALIRSILELPGIADDGGRHIGTRSVIRRIELVYGAPYGVDIHSAIGKGTLVRLRLPYHSAGGGNGYDRKAARRG